MRDELLNETLFFSLDQARNVIAAWVEDYNTTRPHAALVYQTPATFAAKLTATGLHAALTDGSARRPVAQSAQKGTTAEASKTCRMKLPWLVMCENADEQFKL